VEVKEEEMKEKEVKEEDMKEKEEELEERTNLRRRLTMSGL